MDKARANASLRALLRRETAASHDRLDRAMAALDLAEAADYAQFLQMQLAARAPIERWAVQHCEEDVRPPSSVPLLKADLQRLGAADVVPESRFDPPPHAHPLGLAWAIAGSHLGNRALLAGLPARAAGLPTSFLADPRLPVFWKRLRPLLDIDAEEAPADDALAAAQAVFACFNGALDACDGRLAA